MRLKMLLNLLSALGSISFRIRFHLTKCKCSKHRYRRGRTQKLRYERLKRGGGQAYSH